MQYPEVVTEDKDPKDLLADKLKELNKQITSGDRKASLEKFNISQGNLSLYMNGNIYDLDKAIKLIEFFKKRIDDRNNKIQSAIS